MQPAFVKLQVLNKPAVKTDMDNSFLKENSRPKPLEANAYG